MTMVDHLYILQLLIAYTCVGVFIATAVITLLALVGLLPILPHFLSRLFNILIVEVVVIAVAAFAGFLRLDPRPVTNTVEQVAATQAELAETETRLEETGRALAIIETTETQANGLPSDTSLPARVYVHVPDTQSRTKAQQAREILEAQKALVPGIENVGQQRSPTASELRYFRRDEAAEAERLAEGLQAGGIDAVARFVPGFENAAIRPRHYELWFGKS
ncbi:MAG: hypothetical protein K5872_19825 [Rhizobiaceae bacterium]|nr:hypothetical protein [Rhizobiaceae bacterium]MCV0408471.1 hypothetical protein [Rhizobiaceae bacterium]